MFFLLCDCQTRIMELQIETLLSLETFRIGNCRQVKSLENHNYDLIEDFAWGPLALVQFGLYFSKILLKWKGGGQNGINSKGFFSRICLNEQQTHKLLRHDSLKN